MIRFKNYSGNVLTIVVSASDKKEYRHLKGLMNKEWQAISYEHSSMSKRTYYTSLMLSQKRDKAVFIVIFPPTCDVEFNTADCAEHFNAFFIRHVSNLTPDEWYIINMVRGIPDKKLITGSDTILGSDDELVTTVNKFLKF